MAYNQPVSARVVLQSRVAQAIQANENTTGAVVTSITNTTAYEQGTCTITFYPIN